MPKGGKKEKSTGPNEARKRGRPRRPPLSEEEVQRRREEKNMQNRQYRANRTVKLKKLEAFAALPENIDKDWDDGDPDAIVEYFLDPKMFTGNLAESSNAASGGGEPHRDPLGMQGETSAAAGSSSGPTTQSSPHNEMF
ncbi:hypothetical protein SLA2020_322170 [Shorea laevis]